MDRVALDAECRTALFPAGDDGQVNGPFVSVLLDDGRRARAEMKHVNQHAPVRGDHGVVCGAYLKRVISAVRTQRTADFIACVNDSAYRDAVERPYSELTLRVTGLDQLVAGISGVAKKRWAVIEAAQLDWGFRWTWRPTARYVTLRRPARSQIWPSRPRSPEN